MSKKPKKSKKRDQLIVTATKLFSEQGFHATGIDQIIEEANVAKMTFYNHFASKNDLIIAVLVRESERQFTEIGNAINDID